MGIHKKILESLASDQAKKAGLVSKGGGAWAKEKGGATVAKTIGGKLVSVGDGETEKEPEKTKSSPKKEPEVSKPTGKVRETVPKQKEAYVSKG